MRSSESGEGVRSVESRMQKPDREGGRNPERGLAVVSSSYWLSANSY